MIKSSLDKLTETEDIEVVWKSYELRPLNMPPLPPAQEQAYKERVAAAWPRTQQMAKEGFGVEMKTHRWGIKSRLALVGAKFAEEKGLGDVYHEAMFKAHFVEDRDLGERQVLVDLAEGIGLDRTEFLTALDAEKYNEQVDQDIAQAQAYGLNGVPAIIIQDKYLVSGAQPLEALRDIVRQVKAREQIE